MILVIGDALIDKYTYARRTRRSPEDKNVWVWSVERREQRPGGALNVAANLASLLPSKPVHYAGILPQSERTWLLWNYSVKDETDLCATTHEPLVKERLVDLDTGEQVLRIDNRESFTPGSITDLEHYFKLAAHKMHDCDAIVVSDYGKGTVSDALIQRLWNVTVPVFVDTKRRDLSIFSNIKNCFVKVNDDEYAKATNFDQVNLIVTHGHKGCSYLSRDKEWSIRIPGTPIFDHSTGCIGAGDAFLAGFVANFEPGGDISAALRWADVAARTSLRKPGTTVITTQEMAEEARYDPYRHARENAG